MVTAESIIKEATMHIVLLFIVGIVIPLFTYFGLKRPLKLVEQALAILGVFFTVELLIYLAPSIWGSLKSIFLFK